MDQTRFACKDICRTEPWGSWAEWRYVRESLFSSSPDLVASALERIRAWRSRGCLSVLVAVTASIIEIQQKDHFFRHDLNGSARQSEEELAMLYCMAILRLVNGVIEKTRKKNQISIGEAADAIGIPRVLIDIRHEGSHRDLPSLRICRIASKKAVDFLLTYYWKPQEEAFPSHIVQKEILEKKIKHRLLAIALCQKAKIAAQTSNSSLRGKRLKKVLRLYSSYSTQVAHVLLEFLLNALDLSDGTAHLEDSQIEINAESKQTAYDEWKSVVLKISRKEPEIIVMLADTILEKMEAQVEMNYKSGEHRPLENSLNSHGFELLLCLFEWLVPHLKMLTTVKCKETSEHQGFLAEKHKASLIGLLRRCLLISSAENKQLRESASTIAHLIGDLCLLHRLKKLSSLGLSDLVPKSIPHGDVVTLSHQEDSLLHAEEKFELIKQYRIKGKAVKPKESDSRPKGRWNVRKHSWGSCPIGNLACATGLSYHASDLVRTKESTNVVKLSHNKECSELKQCNKRKAESGIQELDNSCIKDLKEIMPDCESDDASSEIVIGHLVIDGVRKKVRQEEFLAIASAVRLLV